jgi:hypothetical protein
MIWWRFDDGGGGGDKLPAVNDRFGSFLPLLLLWWGAAHAAKAPFYQSASSVPSLMNMETRALCILQVRFSVDMWFWHWMQFQYVNQLSHLLCSYL